MTRIWWQSNQGTVWIRQGSLGEVVIPRLFDFRNKQYYKIHLQEFLLGAYNIVIGSRSWGPKL
jgi:hypothetical protein